MTWQGYYGAIGFGGRWFLGFLIVFWIVFGIVFYIWYCIMYLVLYYVLYSVLGSINSLDLYTTTILLIAFMMSVHFDIVLFWYP